MRDRSEPQFELHSRSGPARPRPRLGGAIAERSRRSDSAPSAGRRIHGVPAPISSGTAYDSSASRNGQSSLVAGRPHAAVDRLLGKDVRGCEGVSELVGVDVGDPGQSVGRATGAFGMRNGSMCSPTASSSSRGFAKYATWEGGSCREAGYGDRGDRSYR